MPNEDDANAVATAEALDDAMVAAIFELLERRGPMTTGDIAAVLEHAQPISSRNSTPRIWLTTSALSPLGLTSFGC